MSSGEAELYGVVKGASEALGMQSIAADLGIDATVHVRTDSSAAVGICARTGIGRVRHLATGQLWVQERIRNHAFKLFKHEAPTTRATFAPSTCPLSYSALTCLRSASTMNADVLSAHLTSPKNVGLPTN